MPPETFFTITPLPAMPTLPTGDGPVERHVTFRFTPDDAKVIDAAIAKAVTGNARGSANRTAALVRICQSYLDAIG